MTYRKLTADFLFDGFQMHSGKMLVLEADGTLVDVAPIVGDDVEKLAGIIAPGFINSHCHLELSGMKGVLPPGSGLVDFLIGVVTRRDEVSDKQAAIQAAHDELWQAGVQAVVDICNGADSMPVKRGSHIHWKNRVEVLSFFDDQLPQRQAYYTDVLQQFHLAGLEAAFTPHAPYSLSPAALQWLNEVTAGGMVTMHNSETAAEHELFLGGGGDFLRLYEAVLPARPSIGNTGKRSMQSWLPYFTEGQTLLLVHNTFVTKEDVQFAKGHAKKYGLQLLYCLCPNANRYIENALPPADMLMNEGCTLLLGTDSYSSNWQLSIASEMEILMQTFPGIKLETALSWATGNGAGLFGNNVGLFKRRTKSGVVQITEKENTRQVKRIV